jgi:hypothetical protein
MPHIFTTTTPQTISSSAKGSVLYHMQKHAASMLKLGTIAFVQCIETSDGKDNWGQCGAQIEFTNGTEIHIKDTDSGTYHLLTPVPVGKDPAPEPSPNIATLRSTAIRAANRVVGAQLDFDLRPENPNGASAIEIAEYEFDAAALKLAAALALSSTTN